MAEPLGIAGSGAIACGLARAASGPYEVVLWARSNGSAERACGQVEDAARVVTDIAELAACPIVVEAIAEETAAKLSVGALAAASGRPERFAAMHVFNPVEKMKLVELSFPDQASAETRRRFHALCDSLGKTAVEVPDSAGFVVNRLLFPYLFDAVRLQEREGLAPEVVDTCMELGVGHPMGPLAVLDFVGLDVAAAIGESIGADVPDRIRELIAEGRLGRKAGAGFYDYNT
jgi:3-hydroxybutyryl-CoA dehydrogenase